MQKENRYLFDTSFLSAFFNKYDVNYFRARVLAADIISKDIVIPIVVIAELANYSRNKTLRKIMVDSALEMADLVPSINKNDLPKYLKFVYSLKKSIKPMDSQILFWAITSNAQLITFDKKLEKLFREVQAK